MNRGPERGRRLLWRVYLYGVLMLVLSAGASLLVGHYVLRPAFEVPTRPSTTWIAWHVADIKDDHARVQRELEDLRERVGIEMSLFEPGGRLVHSNAASPPRPLSERALRSLQQERTRFVSGDGRVAIFDARDRLLNYVLIQYPQPSPFGLAAGQLVVALIVLALLAAPLARSIALPVERLAELTRAFGSGDFSARAGLERRGDEIGDLARAFDEMAERLAELRRTELELLANVSHELRTPLSRIRLALELVRDGDVRKADRHIDDIAQELVELEHLIDDVMTTTRLSLARGATGDSLPPLHRQRILGSELLQASVTRFRRHHPERRLVCNVDADLPALELDPVLVRRAFDNLLDNAAKFSDSETTIELTAVSKQGGVEVSVADEGLGIAAEDQARLFEPFYRADRSRTRQTGGVGLGLALVKRIVQAHGGAIRIESEPGAGSRFVVTLPVEGASPVLE